MFSGTLRNTTYAGIPLSRVTVGFKRDGKLVTKTFVRDTSGAFLVPLTVNTGADTLGTDAQDPTVTPKTR